MNVSCVSSGVHQGACTSCPLFTFFIDETVQAVSQAGPDDWLGDLHLLLFMDDTVIFSSTREKLEEKLYLLKRCTNDIGMSMHPSKSHFISVNKKDNQPIQHFGAY